jgi:hypothetical protein
MRYAVYTHFLTLPMSMRLSVFRFYLECQIKSRLIQVTYSLTIRRK